MAKKKSYNTIPDLLTDWGKDTTNDNLPFAGSSVQAFLKSQLTSLQNSLASKAGHTRWVKDGDFYYLQGFASEADAKTYDSDTETYASLLLFNQQLPISTVQGDSYAAYLFGEDTASVDYVVSGDTFKVKLRFSAVRISNGQRDNMGTPGNLTIQRSTDGGSTWTTVETRKGVLTSTAYDSTTMTDVDIASALSTGSQKIRARASFEYEGEDGTTKTAYSTFVLIGNTINKTSISIALASSQQPYTPIWVSQLGASGSRKFPLAYVCNGNVAKTLNYIIYDETGAQIFPTSGIGTKTGITQNGETVTLNVGSETDNPKLFTHGVKTVMAWLTCDDGQGGTIYSNGIISRFMVVNESDAATRGIEDNRYFLLQQAIPADKMLETAAQQNANAVRLAYFDAFTNYTEGTLFDYALFVPTKDENGNIILDTETKVDITFYLSNYISGTWSPTADGVTLYLEQNEQKTASRSELYHFAPSVEIDSTSTSLYAYLHVWFNDNGTATDFLEQSSGTGVYSIPIDNSESYAPVSGTTFLINPRTRNNTEANPARILNAASGNAEVESAFTNFDFRTDGWVSDGSQRVLRIPSGRLLNIKTNPFAQFRINPKSSLLMEMEFKMSNITNEDDAIIKIGETVSDTFRGLRIFPLRGELWVKSYGDHTQDIDFGWREGEKVHLTIAFCANVNPVKYGLKYGTIDVHVPDTASSYYKDPTSTTIGIAKIFIGGNKQREVHFNVEDADEFCTAAMSNNGIFIGTTGADIDIYSFRMYANKEFSDDDVLTNYISSLSTTAEKKQLASDNDILSDEVGKSGKVVSIDKVQAKGKNTLLWHGQEASYLQQSDNINGWLEIKKYDSDGNFLPKFSGSLCRTTGIEVLTGNKSDINKSLADKSFPFIKGQGSSAKTYWDWNEQFDLSKFKSQIQITKDKFDSSITISDTITLDDGSTVVEIYGGCLGADFPLGNTPKQYPIDTTTGLITVPDGWIDGNGILIGETGTVWHSNGDEDTVEGTGYYRGPCYQVAEGTPLFQKGVWKINYASCQQSHLTGVNNIYNDIHTAIVGQNDLQKAAAANGQQCRVAKYTEPFFLFIKYDDQSDVLFRGGCTYGAGKMDKSTWGYAKKYKGIDGIKKFCMFEGSDNSLTGTDFRVPFTWRPSGSCHDEVTYSTKDEGFGVTEGSGTDAKWSQCWDFDGGATYDEDDELADATHKKDYPKEDIIKLFADFANFIYLHNPAIKPYTSGDGTLDSFKTSDEAKNYYTKYWMTQGDNQYRLYRYSFGAGEWVDAGLWTQLSDGTYGWEPVYVNSSEPFKYAYSLYGTQYAAQPDKLNTELINGVVADFKARLPLYMDPKSLQVYYGLEVHFFCGTDNCGKNTYIVLSQFGRTVTITLPDGTTETHEGVCRFEMHSDDVDTTMAIDNNGRVTHDYDVDRMHPYNKDDATTTATYSGMNNVLFNLCEAAWDSGTDDTMRTMMQTIFTTMCGLATERDNIPGFPYAKTQQATVLGALYKYIFYVESYFPARAYNEQGRIRYEYPETLGFITARQVKPIWQSQGSMDQYELEFMFRRIVYMVSYAAWGPAGKGGGTGIPDADEGGFAMMGTQYPDGTQRVSIAVQVTAHQTIYPTGNVSGDAGATIDPHVRIRAGEKYTLSLGDNTFEKDTYFYVYLRNYYRSFGNLAGVSISSDQTFQLNGKRLTEFILDPDSVTHYTDTQDGSATKGESIVPFRPSGFEIGTAVNLQHLDIHGIQSIKGDVNIANLTRLIDFNAEGTKVATVEVPETYSLTTLKYPATITGISLPDQYGLQTLTAEGYSNLTSLLVGNKTPDDAVVPFVILCAANATQAVKITLDNVAWDEGFVMSVLMWMIRQSEFKGTGYVTVSGNLTSSAVKNVSDILGEDCFYADALTDGKLYVKTGGGNFLTGPETVVSGGTADYKMTVIPKSDYTPSFRLADYERTATDSNGDTLYYVGTTAINSRTGHLTTEESISDSKVTVQGWYSDTQHIDLAVSVTKTTYPQEIRFISGASAIKETGDYEYSSVVYPANYTGSADYLWEITSGETSGLSLVQSGNACTLKATSVPQSFNKITLRLTVTCGNGTSLTKSKDVFFSKEQPIVTADTNAAVMAVCYAKGWAANETYMLASEAAAVDDLGEAFAGNTALQHFEQLQYFTGLTKIADNAFKGCTALEDVTLPSQVKEIGSHAYDGCTSLTTISIPYVQVIGDYAFYGCSGVRELTFGDALVSFGTEAFTDMQITEVSFGSNVTNISLDAFDNCQKLTTVTVSSNRYQTWGMAFKNCRSLAEYKVEDVDGAYAYLKVADGIIYRTDSDTIVAVPQACTTFTTTGYTIADYAFYWNQKTIGYTVFNNADYSCELTQGNKDSLDSAMKDYIAAMKFYVFNSKGTQMAEIVSATFEGDYTNGMTAGTVTFADGKTANISDLNAAGCNFMAWRPEMNFKSYTDDDGNEILQQGGCVPIDGGKTFAGRFIGMFKAFNQSGVLKSQPGRIPTGSVTIANFQTYAQAGGSDYGLWNYHDWCKENALHISHFANTNYEVNVGTGRINNYNNVRNIVTGFTLPMLSGENHGLGKAATVDSAGNSVNCLDFFGIEGLGEQIWEFVIGYRADANTQYFKDGNGWSQTFTPDYTLERTINSASGSYVRQIIGGEHFCMMPRVVGGSSSTGWADGTWASYNSNDLTEGRLLYVGSSALYGSLCGLAASSSNFGFGRADATLGARLAFYGTRPTEITGAKFVASLSA